MRIVISYRAIDNIAGGVERMATSLMNAMIKRGHEVHFITLDKKEATSFYPMDKKILWHKMDMGNYREKASWQLRFKRAKTARALLKKINPDIITSFQGGSFLSMRAYSATMGIPVILAERISPSHFDFTKAGRLRSVFYQLYRTANLITVQCESYISQYPAYLQHKIRTIPNPVFPARGAANPAGTKNDAKTLLCVGRIGYQKNQLCLIESFACLHKKHPEWKLFLAGDADNKEAANLIKKLNIEEKVEMPGAVKNINDLYEQAHLFCLPSRWEGFPNALAEAMSYGLPAVGFRQCGGVQDLIQHEKSGLLANGNENLQTLTTALDNLMSNDQKRAQMGKEGAKWIKQFEPNKIYDLWEETFVQLATSYK